MTQLSNRTSLWPEYVKIGEIVYPPGGTLGPRIQSTIELVMIHAGEMTVWVDDVPYHAEAETVTLLFPGHVERFVFSKRKNTRHSFLHIAVPELAPNYSERLHQLPRTLPLSVEMHNLTRSALALRMTVLSTGEDMLKALAVQMLLRYIGEAEDLCDESDNIAREAAVECARRFIERNLREDLTLNDIANAVAVSASHLNRLFQGELNITPIAYLWKRRVSLGVDLLENTGLSVSLIATRCGFKTRNHFSRRVHEATGLSPTELRRRAWQRH